MGERIRRREYYIPKNYSGSTKRFGLFRDRNLLEAAIVLIVVEKKLYDVPFTFQFKIGIMAISGILLFMLFAFGIYDESVTQFVGGYIHHLRSKKRLSMRSPQKGDGMSEEPKNKSKMAKPKKKKRRAS